MRKHLLSLDCNLCPCAILTIIPKWFCLFIITKPLVSVKKKHLKLFSPFYWNCGLQFSLTLFFCLGNSSVFIYIATQHWAFHIVEGMLRFLLSVLISVWGSFLKLKVAWKVAEGNLEFLVLLVHQTCTPCMANTVMRKEPRLQASLTSPLVLKPHLHPCYHCLLIEFSISLSLLPLSNWLSKVLRHDVISNTLYTN